MDLKALRKNLLSKFIVVSLVLWIGSIVGFIFVLVYTIGVRQQTFDKAPTVFAVLLLGFVILGCVAFGLLIILAALKVMLKNKWLSYKKSLKGFFLFISKFLLLLAILPLFLIWRVFKQRKNSLITRLIQLFIVIVTTLPIWVSGYWVIGTITAHQLGYLPESISVAGTGSMYPTFPKGQTKTPQEQAKELVATPGMFRYPNGLNMFNVRLFGHSLERGDIVLVDNQKIRESTKKITGEETGWVKRLIGLPGDAIELKGGTVYLNGKPYEEPYIAKPRSTFGEGFLKECNKIEVPKDSIFVMGDNRKGSGDSRELGFIDISAVKYVLPFSQQKGVASKYWRDTSKDFEESSKIKLDKNKYVELLNQERKNAGLQIFKYQPKLEQSASKRGAVILKYDDFSYEATKSGYPQLNAMNDVGYSNIIWNEGITQGYYESDELFEYLSESSEWKKNILLEPKLQEVGISEVEGNLNGCPTQVIVQNFAGYVPPNYEKSVIQSWQDVVNNLNSIIPSWEGIKGKNLVNEQELSHLLDLLNRERTIAINILAKMDANKWLTKEEENSINEYDTLAKESSSLANKLNGR